MVIMLVFQNRRKAPDGRKSQHPLNSEASA